jgi:hypothetical protein
MENQRFKNMEFRINIMKKITLTIDDDIYNFLEENFVNKSAFIRALITKHYTEKRINIPILKEDNFDFFDQQRIINGGSTPAEILEERENERTTETDS